MKDIQKGWRGEHDSLGKIREYKFYHRIRKFEVESAPKRMK